MKKLSIIYSLLCIPLLIFSMSLNGYATDLPPGALPLDKLLTSQGAAGGYDFGYVLLEDVGDKLHLTVNLAENLGDSAYVKSIAMNYAPNVFSKWVTFSFGDKAATNKEDSIKVGDFPAFFDVLVNLPSKATQDYVFDADISASLKKNAVALSLDDFKVGPNGNGYGDLYVAVQIGGLGKDSFWAGDSPPAVPEPATMLLVGSGIVGVAGFRRRFGRR